MEAVRADSRERIWEEFIIDLSGAILSAVLHRAAAD